jgi:Cu(I)/Ag(I) efflux system membrane fusion protein
MTRPLSPRLSLGLAAASLALAAGVAGYGVALVMHRDAARTDPVDGRKILYWYDPMVPSQRFDKPGKSPFMDMQLTPKYADEAPNTPGVAIDPARTQQLGLRVVAAEAGTLDSAITATGTIDFNQRDIAIVQARTAGFVQRVYARAPGDVIDAGAALADVLVPEWAGAQAEYLAVRRTGDGALANAARQRLGLLGMPTGTIAAIERSGRPSSVVTISSPSAGVIKTLVIRAGMTLAAGQTLAEVNGLGTVWLNAAIPEALAGQVKPGQSATATLAAFPGEHFAGRVTVLLPDVQIETRTLTARIELPNRGGRLKPGMFATVDLGGTGRSALFVPSEAVIRTGKRTLVMLAMANGRYQPAEVRTGAEAGGRTEILAGLSNGEKVVASGQFLIDSEASLSGVTARPIAGSAKPAPAKQATLYETTGRITAMDANSITLDHRPVPTLKWPAMTMRFRLINAALARGLKTGDQVRFGFDQPPQGPTIRQVTRETGR